MGIIALIFLFVALVLIGVGIALGLVACLFAALLLGMGVLSTSFIIGFLTRSRAEGIRAFLLQAGVLIGIPAGAASAWLGQTLVTGAAGGWPVATCGALAGAIAGILVALMLDVVSQHLHRWAVDRFKPAGKPSPDAIRHHPEAPET
jgi:hypothetical protein